MRAHLLRYECGVEVVGECASPKYSDDGFCDDENNNAGCAWDNGDCCGAAVKKNFCSDCKCLDCNWEPDVGACGLPLLASCGSPAFKGDGFCDDNNNIEGCDWDNGDCCGSSNNYKYCAACGCNDCNYVPPGVSACVRGVFLCSWCPIGFVVGIPVISFG